MSERDRVHTAFTLVELLVVIAIIGGMREWRNHVADELKTVVPMFVCPTDFGPPKVDGGHPDLIGFFGNYIMCAGSTTYGARSFSQIVYRMDGMFYMYSKTRVGDVLDGTSQTLMACGGVRGGMTYGTTDDFGFRAVENRLHVHDLHATILYAMGLDHEALTYRFSGRDFRLTDVSGRIVKDIFA